MLSAPRRGEPMQSWFSPAILNVSVKGLTFSRRGLAPDYSLPASTTATRSPASDLCTNHSSTAALTWTLEQKTPWEMPLAVARWMGQNGLTSIIVVTSNFHLPRALLELGCVLPDVRSIPHPVVAGMVDLEDWRSSTAFKVLAAEYAKFLAVWMRTRLIGCASFQSTAGELMLGHALGPGR